MVTILNKASYRVYLCTSPVRSLSRVRIQGFRGVVADRFHDAQPFRPPLSEQDPFAHREVFRALHEPERDGRAVARPDERPVEVDDGARLADGANVQHGLVFRPDGGRVREDQDLGDELPVDFGRGVGFGQHDHALADFLPADSFQSERGGLTRAANGDRDAFPFNGADVGGGELANGVGSDQDGIAGVDDTAFHNAGYDRADKGH